MKTREQKILDDRRRSKLRALGRPPLLTDPKDVARVRAHVKFLVGTGMSMARVAKLAGLSQSTVAELHRGHRQAHPGSGREALPVTTVLRRVHDAILAVRPEAAPAAHGARSAAVGSVRRLRAMMADGFTARFLASAIGMSVPNLSRITAGTTRSEGPDQFLFAATRDRIAEMYAKYDGVKAADVGIRPWVVVRYTRESASKGYAPRSCWDEDTIDDPQAIPEWTGACGSYRGYNIHRRENIFVCPACAAAAAEYNREGRNRGGRPSKLPRKEDQQSDQPVHDPI